MRKKLPKLLVTGGAGFIGSEFIRQSIPLGYRTVLVDRLTYAGDLERLKIVKNKFKFYKIDICNKNKLDRVFKEEKPDAVINFAAESHVDRSILESKSFIDTNIGGTQIILDLIKKYKISRFLHISTDEVYGDIKKGKFLESSSLRPSSPYSASKAAADLLVNSYVRTYNIPAIIIRPANNYGPWQYPEKLIPVIIYKAINNEKIPIYAKGLNKREWLYVSDCARAIFLILKKGKTNTIYNISSGQEKSNIEVAKAIIKLLGKNNNLIKFIKDRLGHDFRYASKTLNLKKLGWKPKVRFDEGIKITVKWYLENKAWFDYKVKYLKNYWNKVYR